VGKLYEYSFILLKRSAKFSSEGLLGYPAEGEGASLSRSQTCPLCHTTKPSSSVKTSFLAKKKSPMYSVFHNAVEKFGIDYI
jgi:hypothetical protein